MTMFKRTLAVLAAATLAFGALAACDEDNDGSKTPDDVKRPKNVNQKEGDLGYSSVCVPLGPKADISWTKSGKKGIADYLASICRLSEYFQSDAFMNRTESQQGIGDPCFCYGPGCNYAGYERPELQETLSKTYNVPMATIYGCDGIPKSHNGATRICLRSSNVDGIKPAIYFPNGMCSLAMSRCTPGSECHPGDDRCKGPEDARALNENTICGFARFGNYDPEKFTSCPNGEVLLDFVMSINLVELKRDATLDIRACFPSCSKDSDCLGHSIYDPIVDEQSQLKCVTVQREDGSEKTGVCFDMRTVAQNAEGYRDLKLVHPGNATATK